MPTTKRKYIESHWLVFALQGVLGLIFGWYVMFTEVTDISSLMLIIAAALLCFGIIEACNIIYRRRRQHDWGLVLAIAIIEIGVAAALFFTRNIEEVAVVSLTILAGYTLLRGFFEILIAAKSLTDATDKFIWIIAGMCGVILGFIIFNAGHLATTTFIQIFGTYMMVLGLANLVYGIHNKSSARLAARAARAKKTTQKRTKK
jgi:uncharacterized membrane protein HdeD (DUF308 family)